MSGSRSRYFLFTHQMIQLFTLGYRSFLNTRWCTSTTSSYLVGSKTAYIKCPIDYRGADDATSRNSTRIKPFLGKLRLFTVYQSAPGTTAVRPHEGPSFRTPWCKPTSSSLNSDRTLLPDYNAPINSEESCNFSSACMTIPSTNRLYIEPNQQPQHLRCSPATTHSTILPIPSQPRIPLLVVFHEHSSIPVAFHTTLAMHFIFGRL